MAVYVTNRLYLPREGMAQVLDFMGVAPLDFNSVQPAPKGLSDEERREWQSAYWGTQGNAVRSELVGNVLSFQTEETPPLAWLRELSAQFPQYEFTLDWFYDDMPDVCQTVVRAGKVRYMSAL